MSYKTPVYIDQRQSLINSTPSISMADRMRSKHANPTFEQQPESLYELRLRYNEEKKISDERKRYLARHEAEYRYMNRHRIGYMYDSD